MKIVDLRKTSKYVLENEINRICGGKDRYKKWLMHLEKGITGLSFVDPIQPSEEYHFKTSIVFYNAGLGLYCRNMYQSYVVLIHADEISALTIHEDASIIAPKKFSFYSLLRKFNVKESKARRYLMPREIILDRSPHVKIRTKDKFFELTIEKTTVEKVKEKLSQSKIYATINIQIINI